MAPLYKVTTEGSIYETFYVRAETDDFARDIAMEDEEVEDEEVEDEEVEDEEVDIDQGFKYWIYDEILPE